eukprot:8273236-Ditylum_brightwellii.AAC.1
MGLNVMRSTHIATDLRGTSHHDIRSVPSKSNAATWLEVEWWEDKEKDENKVEPLVLHMSKQLCETIQLIDEEEHIDVKSGMIRS